MVPRGTLVLCVCGVSSEAWVRRHDGTNYVDVDAAIVMDHIVLAATSGPGYLLLDRRVQSMLHEVSTCPQDIIGSLHRWAIPTTIRGQAAQGTLDLVKFGPWPNLRR